LAARIWGKSIEEGGNPRAAANGREADILLPISTSQVKLPH